MLARGDDGEALARHLTANASLVLEHGTPRERALFRALRRMTRSAKRSVYREPDRPREGTPSRLATWVEAIAHDAAAFVDGETNERPNAPPIEEWPPLSEAAPSDIPALERARRSGAGSKGRASWKRVLFLWTVLIVMFVAIWEFLTPKHRADGTRDVPSPSGETQPVRDAGPAGSTSALASGSVVLVPIAIVIACFLVREAPARARPPARGRASAGSPR